LGAHTSKPSFGETQEGWKGGNGRKVKERREKKRREKVRYRSVTAWSDIAKPKVRWLAGKGSTGNSDPLFPQQDERKGSILFSLKGKSNQTTGWNNTTRIHDSLFESNET
jgi:hypothetical protein